jgi:hypothetical protein
MAELNEITRTVVIERAGEIISIEVHVHLTAEEIERIVTPAVLKSLSRQLRMQRVAIHHSGKRGQPQAILED